MSAALPITWRKKPTFPMNKKFSTRRRLAVILLAVGLLLFICIGRAVGLVLVNGSEYDFSFSGLKTAVINHVHNMEMRMPLKAS